MCSGLFMRKFVYGLLFVLLCMSAYATIYAGKCYFDTSHIRCVNFEGYDGGVTLVLEAVSGDMGSVQVRTGETDCIPYDFNLSLSERIQINCTVETSGLDSLPTYDSEANISFTQLDTGLESVSGGRVFQSGPRPNYALKVFGVIMLVFLFSSLIYIPYKVFMHFSESNLFFRILFAVWSIPLVTMAAIFLYVFGSYFFL